MTFQLVRRLTDSIQAGDLRPGDRLPTESQLAQTHGVSRTVVREAMSRLNAQGLIETQQGRGSFVLASPSLVSFAVDPGGVRSLEDLSELLEFRICFETESASLAAARADSRKIAAIGQALAGFIDEVGRPSESVRADFEFHRSIAVASGNRHLLQILDSLGRTAIATPRARLAVSNDEDGGAHHRVVAVEHQNIYEAIARRNPEDARAAMRVHLSNSRQRLTSISRGAGLQPADDLVEPVDNP
jgi:DNA-binding FadR family transcriptional regulator